MLTRELDVACRLARAASEAVLKYYKEGFEVEHKIGSDNFREPVTIADREASRIIVEGLRAAFPDDGILSEEEDDDAAGRAASSRVWIIDPIDGTAGFIEKDGDFGIQIGLAEDGIPVVGVVMLPVHDALYYAVKGSGAYSITGGGEPVQLSTSDHADPRSLGLALSRHHPSKRMSRIMKHFGFRRAVRRGSVGLKVSLITRRQADLYISPGSRTKLWDTCAPQVIVEEAGGRLTDLFGDPFRYDREDVQNYNGILASNGPSHQAVVDGLRPLLAEFGRVPHNY